MIITVCLGKKEWVTEYEYHCGHVGDQPLKTIQIELTPEQESMIKQNGWDIKHVYIEPEQ